MFYPIIVHIANDCGYKILCFWTNLRKYQTLVPAKNSHLKVEVIINFSVLNVHSCYRPIDN